MASAKEITAKDVIGSAGDFVSDTYLGTNKIEQRMNAGQSVADKNINDMTEREYQKYMTDYLRSLDLEADSTKISRTYNELLKLGLNPRLVLDNLQTGQVKASSGYSYSESNSKSQSSSLSFSGSAMVASILSILGLILVSL